MRAGLVGPFSFFYISEADFVVVIVMATIPGKMNMATRENPEERKAGDRDLVPSTTKEEQADANGRKKKLRKRPLEIFEVLGTGPLLGHALPSAALFALLARSHAGSS